jgi:hypothetical protein
VSVEASQPTAPGVDIASRESRVVTRSQNEQSD